MAIPSLLLGSLAETRGKMKQRAATAPMFSIGLLLAASQLLLLPVAESTESKRDGEVLRYE